MKYCKCKYKSCDDEGLSFIMGNSGYCERCERYISAKTIIRLFGSSQPGKLIKIKDDHGDKHLIWRDKR